MTTEDRELDYAINELKEINNKLFYDELKETLDQYCREVNKNCEASIQEMRALEDILKNFNEDSQKIINDSMDDKITKMDKFISEKEKELKEIYNAFIIIKQAYQDTLDTFQTELKGNSEIMSSGIKSIISNGEKLSNKIEKSNDMTIQRINEALNEYGINMNNGVNEFVGKYEKCIEDIHNSFNSKIESIKEIQAKKYDEVCELINLKDKENKKYNNRLLIIGVLQILLIVGVLVMNL